MAIFRVRLRVIAVLAAYAVVGTSAVAGAPALAVTADGALAVAAGPSDPTDRYRTLVRRFADLDPRWEVRTAA